MTATPLAPPPAVTVAAPPTDDRDPRARLGRLFAPESWRPPYEPSVMSISTAPTMPPTYARTKLFDPLGIDTVEWMGDLAGMPSAASGLRLRGRDVAKIGSLYLHGGQWNGRRVLPADWVERSTRRQFRFARESGRDRPGAAPEKVGAFGYGYFWWYSCYPTSRGLVEARTAVGNGQQRAFVLPGFDMVVTILAGRYNDFTTGNTLGTRVLLDHVVPAVRSGARAGCPGA